MLNHCLIFPGSNRSLCSAFSRDFLVNIIIINSLFKVGVGDSTRLINANHNYNSMKLE